MDQHNEQIQQKRMYYSDQHKHNLGKCINKRNVHTLGKCINLKNKHNNSKCNFVFYAAI